MATQNTDDSKEKLKGGFARLFQKISDVIEDAASLEVTTFTGDFQYKVSEVLRNDVDKVKIENILKSLTVQNNAELQLVAYTNVKIDSDVSTIVKSNLTPDDQELLKLHKDMLQSSHEARQSIINLVKDLIK
jgi:hypothetical protein